MKSLRDEIRLDGGWVDLISSAQQISSEHRSDFIALCASSLKNKPITKIMVFLTDDGFFDTLNRALQNCSALLLLFFHLSQEQ